MIGRAQMHAENCYQEGVCRNGMEGNISGERVPLLRWFAWWMRDSFNAR